MLETDNLIYRFNKLSHDTRIFSPVIQEIAKRNLLVFVRIFEINCNDSIYKKIRLNSYDISMSIYSTVKAIYDLHQKTWERSWFLIHILNTIRTMQDRIHVQPNADNRFRIDCRKKVIPNVKRVIKENSHFELDNKHIKLLEVSLVNYFLRQIEYPLITGENIVKCGLTEDALENDLIEVFNLWFK